MISGSKVCDGQDLSIGDWATEAEYVLSTPTKGLPGGFSGAATSPRLKTSFMRDDNRGQVVSGSCFTVV
jgi:hypothetical protein